MLRQRPGCELLSTALVDIVNAGRPIKEALTAQKPTSTTVASLYVTIRDLTSLPLSSGLYASTHGFKYSIAGVQAIHLNTGAHDFCE